MTGAEWIADKINSSCGGVDAAVEGKDILFVRRSDKPDAYVGVIPTTPRDPTPVVGLDAARAVFSQQPKVEMIVTIPRGARWAGTTMTWLQMNDVAFGGVGDLLSAIIYDEEMSVHRNKTFAFVDDGLRRHSRVETLEWIDSKKVQINLWNDKKVTVALEDAYDITMSVARDAARTLGSFDLLLKTNPNGSITSNGAADAERLGFETLKWGGLFGYLAKKGGPAGKDALARRLRRS